MRTDLVTAWVSVAATSSVALAVSTPCSSELEVSWVVDSSATASDLARAANCSGGVFNVEWIGHVEFPETINVTDGTVLDITGAGAGAIADGASRSQFLNVVNATVRVSGLHVQDCATLSSGGAIYAEASAMSFNETAWSNNFAGENGGAVAVYNSSSVSWGGNTTWSNNIAGENGGGIYVIGSSNVSWSGDFTSSSNTAGENGGAVCVVASSDISWNGDTTWSQNTAGLSGGAVYVETGSDISWSGPTTWTSNTAVDNGGAVAVLDSLDVSWSAEMMWSINTAGLNGGAIYVLSSTVLPMNSSHFEGNTADTGGAIMLSGVDIGPKIGQTNFTVNHSQRGGAVFSVSSGIATDEFGSLAFPTTYESCLFTDNWVNVTGGAIETIAGYDHAVNTAFEGNTASVGGALRLFGSAILTNCNFVENSAEDTGPAISNLGVLYMEGTASRFSGNTFSCENGKVLTYENGNRYAAVCDGCPVDSYWLGLVEDEEKVPSKCVEQPEHTRNPDGDATIETLLLDRGYWRTTNDSVNVLACYNEDACKGGRTDDPAFCKLGYEGPFCSVCSGGYSRSQAFTCAKCADNRGIIAILAIGGVVVLGAAAAVCMNLLSGDMDGTRRGVIHRFTERLPLPSFKIVVVAWQIVTQFATLANVTYPDMYQRFLDGVGILNFDVLWIPSAGCIVDVDFHDRLLVSTMGPLVVLALLARTYIVAKRRNCVSRAALQKVGQKHMSMVLLISFLVYSSVSTTVFQAFACEGLDDGVAYLRVDYRIECDSSKHRAFQVLAGFMILVYPVGIPLFYAYLLYKHRRVLKGEDEVARETSSEAQSISDLWTPYKPGRFYYEVIECLRRMSLTGVVVFIYPNTAAQVAVTLVIAFSFVVVSERFAPYVSKWDSCISLTGHIIVFMSMYVALLSKVDVSEERPVSQNMLGRTLVAAHACLVVAVVVETLVICCSMGRNEDRSIEMVSGPGSIARGHVDPANTPSSK